MKCKFFIWLSVISALVMNISTGIQWENAYIIFWIALCTLVIGVIGALVCGGGKTLWMYLEKIL